MVASLSGGLELRSGSAGGESAEPGVTRPPVAAAAAATTFAPSASAYSRLKAVDLAAGFTSGCAIVMVGHPFETVRTRMQTTGGKLPGAMLRRSAPNLRAVTSQMVQDLGLVTGLYRGAAPPMLSSGVVSMMIWSSFETLKRRIHSHSPADTPVSLVTIWIAAACAPMTVLPITVPQQRLSKLLQVNSRKGDFVSARSCARAILRTEGVRGLYRGGSALAIQDFVGRGNYVTCYEATKRCFRRAQHGGGDGKGGDQLNTAQRMIAGAASGTMGWVFTYPMDCVKARMMTQKPGEVRWDRVCSCVFETWQQGGVRGFYRGIGLCLARGIPVAMVALPTYDLARHTLATWALIADN